MAEKRKKSKALPTISYQDALKIGPRAFVRNYLFPAMRREHGNGFAMDIWSSIETPGDEVEFYCVDRLVPTCGTICCIGGTCQMITKMRRIDPRSEYSFNTKLKSKKLGALLGLNFDEVNALFYYSWPLDLSDAFFDAKTPIQKERVAEKATLYYMKQAEIRRKKEAQHG